MSDAHWGNGIQKDPMSPQLAAFFKLLVRGVPQPIAERIYFAVLRAYRFPS